MSNALLYVARSKQGDKIFDGILLGGEKFRILSKYSKEGEKMKKIALMILLLVFASGLEGCCPWWWHHGGGHYGGRR